MEISIIALFQLGIGIDLYGHNDGMENFWYKGRVGTRGNPLNPF